MQQYAFESEDPYTRYEGEFGQEWEEEVRGRGRASVGRGFRRPSGRPPRRPPIGAGPGRRRPPRPRRPRWRGSYWAPAVVVSEPEPGPAAEGSEYVRWVQSVLNQALGANLPVDGFMGPETRDAIRHFQRQRGLPVDGIVGPQTEQALREAQAHPAAPPPAGPSTPPLDEQQLELEAEGWEAEVNRSGAAYARWIQQSLNRILGLQLAADGISGPQTRSAVRSFQQRAGLAVDGIVGPQTESALIAAGAGQPPRGGATPSRPGPSASVNTALPASGPGFYSTVASNRRYGIAPTIRVLQGIGAFWQQAYPSGPRIGIGDISFQGGGAMPPHKSHDKGLDVDIRLARNDGLEAPTRYQDRSYSRALTQDLVNRIINNGLLRVQYLFFNDPAVTSVRPWPGHDNHLHVRFYAP